MKENIRNLKSYKINHIIRHFLTLICFKTVCLAHEWASESPQVWAKEPQYSGAKITALDVICGKEYMTVRAEFSAPFNGIISSKGTYGQNNCVYIKPFSSISHATFNVKYDECGTKPDLQGKYYENTIVIQYGTDIIEAWDEAKRLRCEWFEAYEKPATFRPAIPVADLDVIEMNFQGDEIDCWMSIQEGKGPWGREVSRIVAVGQPMTIVVAINDYKNQFDMRVKSCMAHDGVKPAIQLTDEYGCVLRPKMLSSFKKIRDSRGKATLISYAQFLAFKFPDSMDVQIQCTVEVCRHGCADACQEESSQNVKNPSMQVSAGMPHVVPQHTTPNHDPRDSSPTRPVRPDEEPQPVFQNIDSSMTATIDHNHHSDEVTNEAVDDYQAVPSIQHLSHINQNFDQMAEHESQTNPVYKPPDHQIRDKDVNVNQKLKIPNLSDLKLRPEDINIANKLLSAHSLNKDNIDLSNLAATFTQGLQHQDIMSLMQTNNVKDLISKFKNRMEEQPIAAALQSVNTNNDIIKDINHNISQTTLLTTEQTVTNSYNTLNTEQTTVQFHNEPEIPLTVNTDFRHPYNHNHNQNQNQIPFKVFNNNNNQLNKKTSNLIEHQLPNKPTPVVQVLDIPLQPGLPFLQIPVLPNNLINNNLMNYPQNPTLLNNSPLNNILKRVIHRPPHGFPAILPNNHFMKRKEQLYNERTGTGGSHIPFGPRSLRFKRSINPTANEIGLKKGFQVVTSVDLDFFPNITTDTAPIYSGRRDNNIIYGVCLPVAHLATGLSCILWLIVVSFSSCAFIIYKLDKSKKSFLSKN
ncbi:putative uncharacterized protein DDB_G0282133 [Oppia nitens]|uniref:putative uncharacterized protein DDB_G0282133 n=1 Tax=Oppia nitens TaxID=1686743 RepID=UPI0023DB5327|nr:putative uncharacterized protein DDB_G0282133 [Oppia nitens]